MAFITTTLVRTLMTGSIGVSKRGPLTSFGINRIAKKNCLTPNLAAQLSREIEKFEHDDESLVGVIYGERGTFSYGINGDDLKENCNIYEEILETGLLYRYPRKPIVAAINGFAIGIGFDLALWCDFRIVEDTAVLASYARNSGIPCNEALISRLAALVGSHRAMDWLLTGRPVKTKEALEAGAITRVVACGTGVGQAVNFAQSLSNMPQASLKANRAMLYMNDGKFVEKEVIRREWEINHQIASKEVQMGIHATMSGDVRRKDCNKALSNTITVS